MITDIVLYQTPTTLLLRAMPSKTLSFNTNDFMEQESDLPQILFITSFPPRECGIATYSQDLITALNNQFHQSFNCSICALESNTEKHEYKHQPKYILNTDSRNTYIKNAFVINKNENIRHSFTKVSVLFRNTSIPQWPCTTGSTRHPGGRTNVRGASIHHPKHPWRHRL